MKHKLIFTFLILLLQTVTTYSFEANAKNSQTPLQLAIEERNNQKCFEQVREYNLNLFESEQSYLSQTNSAGEIVPQQLNIRISEKCKSGLWTTKLTASIAASVPTKDWFESDVISHEERAYVISRLFHLNQISQVCYFPTDKKLKCRDSNLIIDKEQIANKIKNESKYIVMAFKGEQKTKSSTIRSRFNSNNFIEQTNRSDEFINCIYNVLASPATYSQNLKSCLVENF